MLQPLVVAAGQTLRRAGKRVGQAWGWVFTNAKRHARRCCSARGRGNAAMALQSLATVKPGWPTARAVPAPKRFRPAAVFSLPSRRADEPRHAFASRPSVPVQRLLARQRRLAWHHVPLGPLLQRNTRGAPAHGVTGKGKRKRFQCQEDGVCNLLTQNVTDRGQRDRGTRQGPGDGQEASGHPAGLVRLRRLSFTVRPCQGRKGAPAKESACTLRTPFSRTRSVSHVPWRPSRTAVLCLVRQA